jgi:hypothetical protein
VTVVQWLALFRVKEKWKDNPSNEEGDNETSSEEHPPLSFRLSLLFRSRFHTEPLYPLFWQTID